MKLKNGIKFNASSCFERKYFCLFYEALGGKKIDTVEVQISDKKTYPNLFMVGKILRIYIIFLQLKGLNNDFQQTGAILQ